MTAKPPHKTRLSWGDHLMEALGWLALVSLWLLVLLQYPNLPEHIPSHFNLAGEVNRSSGRASIFALPILGTCLFLGLGLLNRYPQLFNYPVPINGHNAERQYRNSTRLLRYLKTMLSVLLLVLTWQTVRTAQTGKTYMGPWLLAGALAVLLLPLGAFVLRSFRLK